MPQKSIIYPLRNGRLELVNDYLQRYRAQVIVCPIDTTISFEEGSVLQTLTADSTKVAPILEAFERKLGPLERGRVYVESTQPDHTSVAYTFNVVTLYQDKQKGRESNNFLVSDPETIREATLNCLGIASLLRIKSICFPVLGNGQGRLSLEDSLQNMASQIMYRLLTGTSITNVGILIPDAQKFRKAKKILDKELK